MQRKPVRRGRREVLAIRRRRRKEPRVQSRFGRRLLCLGGDRRGRPVRRPRSPRHRSSRRRLARRPAGRDQGRRLLRQRRARRQGADDARVLCGAVPAQRGQKAQTPHPLHLGRQRGVGLEVYRALSPKRGSAQRGHFARRRLSRHQLRKGGRSRPPDVRKAQRGHLFEGRREGQCRDARMPRKGERRDRVRPCRERLGRSDRACRPRRGGARLDAVRGRERRLEDAQNARRFLARMRTARRAFVRSRRLGARDSMPRRKERSADL